MQPHPGVVSTVILCLVIGAGCTPKKEEHKSMFSKVMTEDITIGTGVEPQAGDRLYVEYIGTLAKGGAQFETNNPDLSETSKNPLSFTLEKNGGVIPGLSEGVKGMKVGGRRKVSIPWQEAYGAVGIEGVAPYADLIFDVKLLYVVKKGEENTIEIKDVQVGTGAVLKVGDTAEVNYKGSYVNKRVFDSTYDRKQTVTFKVGAAEAITGFDKAMEGMRVGGKRQIILAPEAGWGQYGSEIIPANAVLIYDVDLVSIKPSGSQ